ncbi:hypothetical protein JS528_10805 [Bifidobacterium sp. MA2]|uniref:Phage protein n=1 Tax=Bifidobacterium santillanense TaxID=2809028 RepID=A0ABS5USR3_9BIFI|nr:hypothetical protein [Bifidobacterium santillanense]MBT1173813.1 hypothetical protein [Bifidobacterium santillanense]
MTSTSGGIRGTSTGTGTAMRRPVGWYRKSAGYRGLPEPARRFVDEVIAELDAIDGAHPTIFKYACLLLDQDRGPRPIKAPGFPIALRNGTRGARSGIDGYLRTLRTDDPEAYRRDCEVRDRAKSLLLERGNEWAVEWCGDRLSANRSGEPYDDPTNMACDIARQWYEGIARDVLDEAVGEDDRLIVGILSTVLSPDGTLSDERTVRAAAGPQYGDTPARLLVDVGRPIDFADYINGAKLRWLEAIGRNFTESFPPSRRGETKPDFGVRNTPRAVRAVRGWISAFAYYDALLHRYCIEPPANAPASGNATPARDWGNVLRAAQRIWVDGYGQSPDDRVVRAIACDAAQSSITRFANAASERGDFRPRADAGERSGTDGRETPNVAEILKYTMNKDGNGVRHVLDDACRRYLPERHAYSIESMEDEGRTSALDRRTVRQWDDDERERTVMRIGYDTLVALFGWMDTESAESHGHCVPFRLTKDQCRTVRDLYADLDEDRIPDKPGDLARTRGMLQRLMDEPAGRNGLARATEMLQRLMYVLGALGRNPFDDVRSIEHDVTLLDGAYRKEDHSVRDGLKLARDAVAVAASGFRPNPDGSAIICRIDPERWHRADGGAAVGNRDRAVSLAASLKAVRRQLDGSSGMLAETERRMRAVRGEAVDALRVDSNGVRHSPATMSDEDVLHIAEHLLAIIQRSALPPVCVEYPRCNRHPASDERSTASIDHRERRRP